MQFGDFDLDLQSGELSRNGARVLLPEQSFRLLSLLVRNPGTLVTRDDLRRELWPDDTFVDFEHSLNAAVKRLREVLGDSAASPTFIETLPKRGYRFLVPVVPIGDYIGAEEDRGRTPLTKPRRRWLRANWVGWGIAGALLVTAAGPHMRREDGIDGSRAPLLTRITSTSGVNLDPALSPDGNLLAYASDRAGSAGTDIWIQPVGGGEPLRLTDHPADDAEPSFSPDGAHIVFSRRDTGLFVIGAVGGRSRLVVQETWARNPRFSPDGEWIVYWTGFPPSVVAGGIPGALGSIHIVPAGGGAARTLQPRVASARYGVWSPDGKRILFLGEDDVDLKSFDWYITNLDGTGLIKTGAIKAIQAAGVRGGPPIPAAWSAHDDAVLFATHEVESSSVWQIPISPSTGQVTARPRPLTSGTASERSPSASANGRVVFSSVAENVDVYRVALDPRSGIATGPLERLTNSTANDRLRSVTSDGKTIAFVSLRTRQDEVWLRDLETEVERQLTFDGASDTTLSPDGSRIALARAPGGEDRLDVLDVTSGLSSTFCRGCRVPADWSFDGTMVLVGGGVPSTVSLHDLASGRQWELAAHPKWNLEQARLSPDGEWVAFHTTNSPNVRQVYAVPALQGRVASESWVPIVTDHGCHPNWSGDGSLVYHMSFRDGSFCPWVQKVDRSTRRPIGRPQPVLHLHDPRLRAASGAWASIDVQGGFLYFTAAEATANIWMLEDKK